MNITNDIITAFINTFYKNENKDLQELRAFAEAQHVPIILRDTEGLLLNLLRIKKPKKILEIGAAVGYSACCFAEGCDCRVVTIESSPQAFEIARNNIENMGFSDRVTVLSGDAREVLVKLAEEAEEAAKDDPEGGFDVVFIDAAKSHYKAFWDLAMPLCNDEAMIICDNVLMKAKTASDEYDPKGKFKTSIRKMRAFLEYISSAETVETSVFAAGDGLAVCVVK